MMDKICSKILIVLLLAGCSLQKKSDAGKNAPTPDFLVENVSLNGKAVDSGLIDTENNTKTKTFNIRSCFKDPLNSRSIIDIGFQYIEDKNVSAHVTNIDGCIFYDKTIVYNYLEQERYIRVNIEIIGDGPFYGTVLLPLAINPWTNDLIDTRYQDLPEVLENQITQKENELNPAADANLLIEKLNYLPTSFSVVGGQPTIELEIYADASIERLTYNQERVFETIEFLPVTLENFILTRQSPSATEPEVIGYIPGPIESEVVKNRLHFNKLTLEMFTTLNPVDTVKIFFTIKPKSEAQVNTYYGYATMAGDNAPVKAANYQTTATDKQAFSDLADQLETTKGSAHPAIASFSIEPVKLVSIESLNAVDELNGYKRSKLAHIKVCLIDNLSKTRIDASEFFASWTGLANNVSVKTDETGCFATSFEQTFNYLEQERFFKLSLSVQGKNSHQDQQHIEVAINPWTGEVRDLRYEEVPGSLYKQETEVANALARLKIDQISLLPEDYKVIGSHQELSFDVHLKGNFEVFNTGGEIKRINFEHIAALIEMKLVHENRNIDDSNIVAELKDTGKIEVENNELIVRNLKLSILRPLKSEDITRLILKIYPEHMDTQNFAPWKGTALVSTDRILVSDQSLQPAPLPEARFDEFWKLSPAAVASRFSSANLEKNRDTETWFYASNWDVNYSGWTEVFDRSQGLARSYFNYRICLNDSTTNQPIVGRDFNVTFSEQENYAYYSVHEEPSETMTTDQAGCLISKQENKLVYAYWAKERYIKRFFKVRSINSLYGNSGGTIPVYINPWREDSSRYYWDATKGEPDYFDEGKETELLVDSVYYEFDTEFMDRAKIDPYLKLTKLEYFDLLLEPKIQRVLYGESHYELERKLIPPGENTRFDLRILYVGNDIDSDNKNLNPIDRKRFISMFEREVRVNFRGQIITKVPIAYDFQERPLLESSAHLYIELAPKGITGYKPKKLYIRVPFNYIFDKRQIKVLHDPQLADFPISTLERDLVPTSHVLKNVEIEDEFRNLLGLNQIDYYRFVKPVKIQSGRPLDLFHENVDWQGETPKMIDLTFHKLTFPEKLKNTEFLDRNFRVLLNDPVSALSNDTMRQLAASFCTTLGRGPNIKHRVEKLISEMPDNKMDTKGLVDFYYQFRKSIGLDENTYTSVRDCLDAPLHHIWVRRFMFVNDIKGEPYNNNLAKEVLSFGASTFRRNAFYERESYNYRKSFSLDRFASGSLGAKTGIDLFGNGAELSGTAGVGLNLGDSWAYSRDDGFSEGLAQSVSLRNTKRLSTLHRTYDFKVEGQLCFYVCKPQLDLESKQIRCEGERYFICKNGTYDTTEHWYYITNRNSVSPIGDRENRALENRYWLVQLRGEQKWVNFVNTVSDENRKIFLEISDHFNDTSANLKYDIKKLKNLNLDMIQGDGLGVFPGVIYEDGLQLLDYEGQVEQNLTPDPDF